MPHATTIEEVVEANFIAFKSVLPTLLASRAGQYALLRDEQVVGFFESAGQAYARGLVDYPDRLFSIQRVAVRAANLGMVSSGMASAVPA